MDNKDEFDSFTKQARKVLSLAPEHVFIAYSRKDFYFAESLFYALQSRGIDAWMDVWKITPGRNWDQAITDAIDSARGLILIATKASLQSPFVKDEIARAYRTHKPIYLVIRGRFSKHDLYISHDSLAKGEMIDLYDYAKIIIDMRVAFKAGVVKIDDAIRKDAVYRTRLPGPLSFKTEWIFYIPPALILLTLLMMVTEVWKYGTGLLFQDLMNQSMGYIRDIIHGRSSEVLLLVSMPLVHFASILGTISFINFTYKFFRRIRLSAGDFFNVMLRDAVGLGILILLQDGTSVYENIDFARSISSSLGNATSVLYVDQEVFNLFRLHCILFFLIIILGMVFTISYRRGARGSILRWLPTGKASQKIRYQGNEEWIRNLPDVSVSPGPSYKSYYIEASEADRSAAEDIRLLLQQKGFAVTDKRRDAECDLLILSAFADDSSLKDDYQLKLKEKYQITTPRPTIYVLARSMEPQKNTALALQWIDYRRPAPDQFWKQWERHFSQLKGDDPSRGRNPVFPYVPEALGNTVLHAKYGCSVMLAMIAVTVSSALLISGMEYLILLRNAPTDWLFLASIAIMLGAVGNSYYTIAQMIRGIISPVEARRRSDNASTLTVIAAVLSQSLLFIIVTLGIMLVNRIVVRQPGLHIWLPPQSKGPNRKSLLQPISNYTVFTSFEYSLIIIGFLALNALLMNYWIIPHTTPQSSSEPYAVTVPGPYYLAAPGLWAQDNLASAFGFHFTYQSDRLEVTQTPTAIGGYTLLEFSGTNAYPMRFAPHFRSSIHIQFSHNDPRTSLGIAFDDASNQEFSIFSSGAWRVSGATNPMHSGRITEQRQAPDYTLEVEVNGRLCMYKINGKEIIAISNTAISSINHILFVFTNTAPGGARFYLSQFIYTPLS